LRRINQRVWTPSVGSPDGWLSATSAGKGTARATTAAAGSFGIAISAKNWLCTAAQTTLPLPARYSVFGVRG